LRSRPGITDITSITKTATDSKAIINGKIFVFVMSKYEVVGISIRRVFIGVGMNEVVGINGKIFAGMGTNAL